VVGEIIAGIALGPSLLGRLPGDLGGKLFPQPVVAHLEILAQLGLVLFMFIVGLELDVLLIRGREKLAGAISAVSVLLPFALGAALSILLYPGHAEISRGPVALALFLGVAMSITAFPVLARILTDRGMHRTSTGVLALACAAVDDIIAWTLLALVVAVVEGDGPLNVLRTVALTALFAGVMFGIVRPLLRRLNSWYRKVGRLTPDILAVVLIGVLVSAFITDRIGIHAIFGAFIFGAIMPREDAADMTTEILERLEQVSVLLLLPLFFVVTGLNTDVRGIIGSSTWQLLLILLTAIGGKFVGAYVAARAMRVPNRQAAALGVLMNTRGLTELVILNVGRQLGVLDKELFTMLVMMALVTTAMTGPLLKRVYPDRVMQRDIEAAERAALGVTNSYRVLVCVDDPERARSLVGVGAAVLGTGRSADLVLTRLVTRLNPPLEVGAALLPDLARMASTVDELNALADELKAQGIACSVLTRFSRDPWTDLVSQAVAVEADVVLVDRTLFDKQPAGRSPDVEHAFSLAVVRLGAAPVQEGDVVAVTVDGTPDGRTALVLASAAAGRLHSSLLIDATDGRRAARKLVSALEPLRSQGVEVQMADSRQVTAPLTLRGGLSAGSLSDSMVTEVLIKAGLDDRDAELGEQLAKLAVSRRA
jgi:Kef-type K+ transport system membrane component KefB